MDSEESEGKVELRAVASCEGMRYPKWQSRELKKEWACHGWTGLRCYRLLYAMIKIFLIVRLGENKCGAGFAVHAGDCCEIFRASFCQALAHSVAAADTIAARWEGTDSAISSQRRTPAICVSSIRSSSRPVSV